MSLLKLIIIYFLVFFYTFLKKIIYTFKINGFEVDSQGANVKNHIYG